MNRRFYIAAIALSIMLASCTLAPSHAATPTATTVPCPFSNDTPSPNAMPTALQITRPYNYLRALPALSHCEQDAERVQRLYATILGLPARAPGVYSCPKSWDVTYTLTFLAGSAVLQMMTLEADGCEFLHVSDTDVRTLDVAFSQQFADMLGLTEAQAFSPFFRP